MNTKGMQSGYLDLTGRGQDFVNNLMPNMQNIAQTQQAPAAPQRWIPPTVQANPNQQFVGYGQSDQFHGQPIDPVRLAIGRALQFDTSPTWAHNLPMSALPQMPTPAAPSANDMSKVMPPGMQFQPLNASSNAAPADGWMGALGQGMQKWGGQAAPSKTMIPRTGKKGPGYGTPSYQKGK